MKLSDLHMCDNCNGPVRTTFYVLRFSIALINPKEANEVLGLTQYFQGALGLAEAMAPNDHPIHIAMDEEESKELMVEALICNDCHIKPINLAMIAERVHDREEHKNDPPMGAGLF